MTFFPSCFFFFFTVCSWYTFFLFVVADNFLAHTVVLECGGSRCICRLWLCWHVFFWVVSNANSSGQEMSEWLRMCVCVSVCVCVCVCVQEYVAEWVLASTPAPYLRSIITSTMMQHAYTNVFRIICLLVLAEGPDPICFNRTTKQELKHNRQFHWSAPLSSRSNWSDRMTESDGGSGP